MANKSLFGSSPAGKSVPVADATNEAGGRAHKLAPRALLAQVACTGTFNKTFYNDGDDQLQLIRQAADQCSPEFVAKCAIYSRQNGGMKDMPAALAVMLSKADPVLLDRVFDRVLDNGKQIRNFVQMVRSGLLGRKSLGSGPKRLIRRWIANRSHRALLRASVGNSPSLADVIRLVHPKAVSEEQKALIGWIVGKEFDAEKLPQVVKDYLRFKGGDTTGPLPDVDFRMLTGLPLTAEQWAEIALKGGWHQTRMNLNSYAKQGVFGVSDEVVMRLAALDTKRPIIDAIAAKLADAETIKKARVFPYQLLAAYLNVDETVPFKVKDALQDAMEIAVQNVPSLETQVHVIVDTSGSMRSPVTGHRAGATTKIQCLDVAALIGAVMLRQNPGSTILPVDTQVHSRCKLNPRDSIMTNATVLKKFGGGGTDLSAGLHYLNASKAKGQLIVIVSDCESWMDSSGGTRGDRYYSYRRSGGTGVMNEFRAYEARNPGAKLVNIDLQPYSTVQAPDAPGSVMNVGGFSDAVFDQVAKFLRGEEEQDWVSTIEAINLDAEGATAS
jgi:60 kDa SS-A/Ro ribonucleoprotein